MAALVLGGIALLVVGVILGMTFLGSTNSERVDMSDQGKDIAEGGSSEDGINAASSDPGPQTDAPVVEGEATEAPMGGEDTTSTSTIQPTTTSSLATITTAPAGPHDQLTQIVGDDEYRAGSLVDYWVPQLSSKKPGLLDKVTGITYDDALILRVHQDLQRRHDAILIWSGSYTTFNHSTGGDFWVSLAPERFSTPEAANQWCDHQSIDADNCFAKLISHTHGSMNATESRK